MPQAPDDHRRRVLFVIGSMGGGGAERQMLEILWRLDRSRFVPILYLAMKQGELLAEVPADVPVHAFWDGGPESRSRRFFRKLKLTRLLRYRHLAAVLRRERIDLVYDRTFLATLDAAGGCWFRPTPRISCCVAEPQPELEQHARFSVRATRWFARRAYLSASLVLANSEGLRRRVIDYFELPEHQVQLFPNLLTEVRQPVNQCREELDSNSPSDDSKSSASKVIHRREDHEIRPLQDCPGTVSDQRVRSVFDRKPGSFVVVSAGRLHPQKGYHYLLQAMVKLIHEQQRDVSLVIFGQGDAQTEYSAYLHTHDLQDHVTLAGFDPNPRRWYPQADLFVLPSLSDAMPNALIEAMLTGIPVLATTCPTGPREILEEGKWGGLVPPADANALADGIMDAMDHSEVWKNRAHRACEVIRQRFDPELGIRRLEALMERLIAR